MNKSNYIEELRKILSAENVPDIEDIVSEYEEHFARKAADGYTEEEIAKKLGDPRALAKEYSGSGETAAKPARFPILLGLGTADIFIALLFVVAFAWIVAIAAGALSVVLLGLGLIASPLFPLEILMIPYMPHVPGILLGVSVVALGALFWILTAYCFMLVKKAAAAFKRWHRSVASGKKSVPYAVFPLAEKKAKRRLRRATVISLIIFAVFFTVAYGLMAAMAGNLEFWHVWKWFVYA